ncbi:MAG TPA: GH92 family glycosyl hydrolase [Dongiaceae bacterium]|nr:GH92 family glycosyl hydrolase [Dongiaceae bacterium]
MKILFNKSPKLCGRLVLALLLAGSGSGPAFAAAAEKTPAELADPAIGTAHSRWFFFTPGAMPFGMAKPGPCTDAHLGTKEGWEAVGYDGRHASIESFVSFREFQIGGIAVMATTGKLQTVPGSLEDPDGGYRSRFDKPDEIARPGYYAVRLKDYNILAELTATERVAYHRFTFPETTAAHVIFDVGHEQGESGPVSDAFVARAGDREVEGFVSTLPAYVRHYQPGAAVKLYFVARLDKTPDHWGTFRGTNTFPQASSIQGLGAGLNLDFEFSRPESVVVKMGLSYTSIANARANLDAEASGVTFDQAREKSRAAWEQMLGRIQVQGGKETDRIKFYTGLYHALLGRGICSDVNGNYPKNDGSVGQIPLNQDGTPKYHHYNSDSVWGSFWNLNQLWALAYPDFYSEFVRCHLDIYRDCGWLPDSIAAEKFVSGVGTDYAGVLVSSAYAWGIRDYDVPEAFAAVYKNETRWQNRLIGVGKADLKPFVEKGYVPLLTSNIMDYSGSTAEGSAYAASHTMEYSFSSGAAAQFGRALGRTNEYAVLLRQSYGWTNLFDLTTGFIRPKDMAGNFVTDFDPQKPWGGFQEGNAFQYTFYVPQDPAGLIATMGLESFRLRLGNIFPMAEKKQFGGGQEMDAFSGLQSVYNHGDQPSLHISWLFNYCGQPWLTQHWVRRICDVFYGTEPVHGYGYGQDEDQGQLGAWYVLAALGLFDVQGGGGAVPTMQLAAPLFQRSIIQLDPRYYRGGSLTIEVSGDPATKGYIQSAAFNGEPLEECWIGWNRLVNQGGKLEMVLGETPNKNWGTKIPPPGDSATSRPKSAL